MPKTAVIVEDDFLIADYLDQICRNIGIKVLALEHEPGAARAAILGLRPEYVLMDVRLGAQQDGIDVAGEVLIEAPETKVVFITGSYEPPTLERMEQHHPHRILIKPISPTDLESALA